MYVHTHFVARREPESDAKKFKASERPWLTDWLTYWLTSACFSRPPRKVAAIPRTLTLTKNNILAHYVIASTHVAKHLPVSLPEMVCLFIFLAHWLKTQIISTLIMMSFFRAILCGCNLSEAYKPPHTECRLQQQAHSRNNKMFVQLIFSMSDML